MGSMMNPVTDQRMIRKGHGLSTKISWFISSFYWMIGRVYWDAYLKISANLQFVIAKLENYAIIDYKILLPSRLNSLIITKNIINSVARIS
jgi:hypothetical protein